MTVLITQHAVQRYQERVANVPEDQARAAMSSRTVDLADAIGAPFVRLGGGQRLVLEDHKVVTVLPRDTWTGTLDRRRVRARRKFTTEGDYHASQCP